MDFARRKNTPSRLFVGCSCHTTSRDLVTPCVTSSSSYVKSLCVILALLVAATLFYYDLASDVVRLL